MKKVFAYSIFISVAVVFLSYCSSGDLCREDTESFTRAGFYRKAGTLEYDTFPDRFSLYGTPPPDTNFMLYENKTEVKSFTMPFDHTQDISSFYLTFRIRDTLFSGDTNIITSTILVDTLFNGDTIIMDPENPDDVLFNGDTIIISETTLFDTVFTGDTSFVENKFRSDQINFTYARKLKLISPDCGFGYHFELDSVFHTDSVIRRIEIINPTVTPEDEFQHVKIYL